MMKMQALFGAVLITCLMPTTAHAWTGYDSNAGSDVEIDKGNLVRQGQTIDFYDHSTNEYRTGDVESVSTSYGSSVEVEVYDHNSGEYRTFDMESE